MSPKNYESRNNKKEFIYKPLKKANIKKKKSKKAKKHKKKVIRTMMIPIFQQNQSIEEESNRSK